MFVRPGSDTEDYFLSVVRAGSRSPTGHLKPRQEILQRNNLASKFMEIKLFIASYI